MKLCSTLVSLALVAGAAQAGIVSTSGQFTHIGAPPSLQAGARFSINGGYAIDEQQHVLVSAPVNRLFPNLNVDYNTSNASRVPLNGWVSSHIIHSDTDNRNFVGTVTFDAPIIALIYLYQDLDISDPALGNPVTIYPNGAAYRGFGPSATGLDTVRLLSPYTVQLTMGQGMDQIRVLTAGVPTPGSVAVLMFGGVLAGRRRRG